MRADVQAAVIGAGAAGLAAARELHARGAELALLEAADRVGGVMQTAEVRGFRFERGPNSCRVPAPVLAFFRRHGLEEALLAAGPEASLRFLFLDRRAVPVPTGPLAALRSPLLSGAGKRRALRELFVAAGDPSGESVAEFVTRRFGPELLVRALAPFLVGVYAGDERELGAEAVFPTLAALERSHGSVLRGALASALRRGKERGLAGSWSAQGGLGALAERLASGLGGALHLGTPTMGLAREGGVWRIEGPNGVVRARSLVLAIPAAAAGELLRPLDREAADVLSAIEYAPVASLALGLDTAATPQPIRGFGLLVPRSAELRLLGALFMSRVFPGRAPAGRELVTALLGGVRWPEAVDASDDELLEQARLGLEATLGLRTAPELLGLTRWPRAIPQPGRQHPARVRALRERSARLGGFALAGGYLEGVALGEALLSGVRAAEAVAEAAGLP